MSAYIIGSYTVFDEETYYEYIKKVGAAIAKYRGNTIVAEHGPTILEGEPNQVTVVVEFESKEVAESWYNSKEYQEIINLRKDSSEGWLIIAEKFLLQF